ncbi:MAG: 5-(carboxyamino)imidazole ribonucleotide synthase, partial [Bacteroidales bacterium]|nr:5-(carboxyamino)imidazole ribonucleotide synthase [Bacteroidales bacterium]
STKAVSAAVMLNLLGEKGYEGEALYEGFDEALRMEGVKVHLYGKKITKPFRKMGHVTIVDVNVESAMEKARELKRILKVKA